MSADLRAWFEGYIAAFNRNDFDGFGAYYAPDVVLPASCPGGGARSGA
jgi:ketosteroid isomerase-like protein